MQHTDSAAATVRHAWNRVVGDSHQQVDSILDRHREPHRRYHTVEHVAAVITAIELRAATEHVDDLDAVIVAAIYHDAIYDSRAADNEAASAELAGTDLASVGWKIERIDRVASMIRGTAGHHDASDRDHAVLFDADLSTLGSASTTYDHYVEAVRAEYAHVSEADWISGRAAVLRSFLDRDTLFHTATGRSLWGRAAIDNLNRELTMLVQP